MTEESRVSTNNGKLATINSIITFDPNHKDSSMIGERSKKQIQDRLHAQATLLIGKKQKKQQKQSKLKQLEQQFQVERVKKQKSIEEKLASSQKNKSKNLSTVQKKLQQYTKWHKSVFVKIQNDKNSQIEKQYDNRKVYDNKAEKCGSQLSHKSNATSRSKQKLPANNPESRELIDQKILEIQTRLDRAKSVSKQKQSTLIQRIRQHNTSEIKNAQQKASKIVEKQIGEFSNKIATKLDHADINKQKYDKSVEKRQEEKQKAYYQKLRSYQTNIKHIEEEQLSKLDDLNKKFLTSMNGTKTWKDQRGEVYHRKFLTNLSMLQQQKINRADQIVQRHQQISMKNKIYKQRKDTLFKAIKCDPFE